MLYQKLLLTEQPYCVLVGDIKKFEKHRHPDIEINFCLSGSYSVKIDNTTLVMNKGDLVIASPMAAHEVLGNDGDNTMLVIVVGTTFLSEYFKYFRNLSSSELHFKLNATKDRVLLELLKETAELRENPSDFSELKVRGNLYKICASILEKISNKNKGDRMTKNLHSISNIEKALELVYHNYNEELKIEEIAKLCGYSASNFCKVFKKITGTTFHKFLNHHRVQVAKKLLAETNVSVEQISYTVGFSNTKNLCRIFKDIMKCSPGYYRKKINQDQ